jgi:hypothetical protein
MTKNGIKLALAVAALAAGVGSATSAVAYPPFLRQAMKFGAKDCLFCHTQPEGGEGWNARGAWLVKEKEKRMAEAIDVEWLKDYKEDPEKKDPEKPEKKDPEKKDPEKPEKKDPEKKDPGKKDPVKDPAGRALDF